MSPPSPFLPALLLCACLLPARGNTLSCRPPDAVPPGYISALQTDARVNLYYVRRANATGPTLLLLHGWPQTWSSWTSVMPLLPARFDVVVPNLRGIAPSDTPPAAYTKTAMARDLAALLTSLRLSAVHVVGHDVGGMVGYAFARLYPQRALSLTFVDAVLPGTPQYVAFLADPRLWHFGFNAAPGFPEALTTGREAFFYPEFMRSVAGGEAVLTPAEVRVTVEAYSVPRTARAGFGWYRAFAEDARENAAFLEEGGKMAVRVLAVNGGRLVAMPYVAEMFEPLAESVTGGVLDAGHWIPEERPQELVDLVVKFVEEGGGWGSSSVWGA